MITSHAHRPRTRRHLAVGLALAVAGLYVVKADDAPGAPVLAAVLMTAGIGAAVSATGRRPSTWTTRGLAAAGAAAAAMAAYLIHAAVLTAPLVARPEDVPSTSAATPSPRAPAVDEARAMARAAVWQQHLPGASIAVGRDGAIIWAEGFGWRDVATRTPVTPATRFNIGTAAAVVMPAVTPLGLVGSGSDDATVWSPGHIGEPEEDFPGFRALRDVVFTPLGLVTPQPLPGDRATFYVPRFNHDPRQGRRLMAMRDLACCASGKAFYSTPSDLVRVAMATGPGSIDGLLAGGRVMSLATRVDASLAVAVTSNMAHADTSSLARRVADAFAAAVR